MQDLRLSPEEEASNLLAAGYCRTSNKYRMVSRIDRPDWREVMAASHPDGMEWVRGLGDASASDHYRRCHSKDTRELSVEVWDALKRKDPGSHGWGAVHDF